ncbi:MAG: anthranilate synthase component I [Chloroflexi bacterium]|nr:anthranilate synthase component I [Chloroflexota bacterium]
MDYHPSIDEVRSLARQGNLVPVYRTIPADLETPVSAYLKVARQAPSFLLESVEGGERLGRYSFIGTDPSRVLATGPGTLAGPVDPLPLVQKELSRYKAVTVSGLPRFIGGAVGYLAYDAVRYFEPRIPTGAPDPLSLPESLFLFCDTLLVFDHVQHVIKIVSHADVDGDPSSAIGGSGQAVARAYREATERIDRLAARLEDPIPLPTPPPRYASHHDSPVTSNFTQQEYEAAVSKLRRYIFEGECIQVVLSQRFRRPTSAAPFDIYRSLRALNPSPYMFFLDLGDFHVVGSSPEMLVRVEDGLLDYHPIAGTRPRGATEGEDEALATELLADEKERAEHIMLVDLGRNDVGRVSVPGTVRVPQLMELERYSHVMHIVSHVTGRLRPELTAYDALRSCFPAGTVSGAPKVRAMELIAELEPHQRGLYAGAVGYFSFSGNMDTAIAIRTMVVKDGIAHVQAGGGIVYDSVPEREYQETQHKAQALLRAISEAEEQTAARRPSRARH